MEQGYLATDASGTIGMGGFFNGASFAVKWAALRRASLPASAARWNRRDLWPTREDPGRDWIPYREMFGVWWALLVWGESFRGRTITLHCDNTVVVDDIIKMRARQRPLMRLLRAIFRFCAEMDVRITMVWLPSAANDLADALSRDQLPLYRSLLARWRLRRPGPAVRWLPRTFRNVPLLTQKASELHARALDQRGGPGNSG